MGYALKLRYFLFFLCYSLAGISHAQQTDTILNQFGADSLPKKRFIQNVKDLATKETKDNLQTYKEGKISIAQRHTIDAIKTVIERVRLYMKEGLDTTSIKETIDQASNSLSIAKDGVLINKGSTQTQRNLTVTAAIISELYNQMSAEKKLLYKYSNNLLDYQNQLDSLSSDSSLFHFPSDSANIIQYAKRLSVVYKEISPVDSSLRSALANMQDLQLKVDLMAFGLQSVMEEIDAYRSNLSTRVVQREVPTIWQPVAFSRPMKEIIKFSLAKEKMELGFYIRGNKGRIFLLFILPFVLFFFIRSVKKMMFQHSLLNSDFTGQLVLKYPFLSSIFIGFTLFQFVFLNPPFIFSFCIWSISIACLVIILHKVLTDYWMKFWYIFIGFFFLASADNFLLQVSRSERWFMLALAGSGFLFLVYILITDRRKELKERGVSYFIPFVAMMQVLSFIFNLFGRFNISKSLLVTGYTGIVVAILFLWTIRLVNEILGISYRVHNLSDRKLSYFNFEKVGKKVPPLFYVLLVIGWFILMGRNFYIFKEIVNPTENFFTEIRKIGEFNFSISDIFVFLFILALSLILSRVISFFATAPAVAQGSAKADRIGVGSWLLLTRIFILSLGVLLAFAATGIPVDKLTIILGALSVGIGLGLQGLVSNLVSGLIIAFEKPVNVGDMLEVNGKMATLKSIGFRSCILRLTDGTHVVIPNNNLLNQNLVNWSMGSFRKRTSIKLGLAYGTDIEKTRALFKTVLEETERILKNPAPDVLAKNFGPYSIEFELTFWVAHVSEFDEVKNNVITKIDSECREAGIQILVPLQEMNLRAKPGQTGQA